MHAWNIIMDWLFARFHLGTSDVLVILAITSMVSRFVGKLIPDDKTGWQGILRDICKVAGLYTSNRIQSHVTVNDVAKEVVASKINFKRK